jgi:hypothetical protein
VIQPTTPDVRAVSPFQFKCSTVSAWVLRALCALNDLDLSGVLLVRVQVHQQTENPEIMWHPISIMRQFMQLAQLTKSIR